MTDLLIDWYLWWISYIPTYWTSNDSHINHDEHLVITVYSNT